ncbi:polar amino acid transport system substrate-binding protein [Propionibacterium cyclohexanicum]|uniref:Polar amino acid transport system substrate-binding protein n=1 Tax=Propionibacterium cyclohexanicum TaxID=64702 RepID=A0A1H9RNI9_9ACTN|nr:ABC transporter substrate-binding protein [Propionibacterium cyclohexanicum]SER74055.1 polar amino acid transport system substrate-binding protein [Propionibacterium cyclohexanicum]
MSRTLSLRAATAGVAILTFFSLSACSGSGSPAEPSGASSASSALPAVSPDAALAGQVPQKFKSKGTLTVGADASYAPNEFIAEDGKTVIGMDVDLVAAVSAKLGLKSEFQNADFGTIILGVSSGKYDMGASSFTINSERLQQVNMVQYLKAGTLWAVQKGNPKKVDPQNPCGLTVAVQKDTVQVDDLAARDKKCTDAGKPAINQIVEVEQSKATADLVSGKADAMLADSPVTSYAVEQSEGALETVGDIYDAAPYGLVFAKEDTEMAELVGKALGELKDDGSYQAILAKWGNASGAVSEFPVNPSVAG